MSQLFYAFVRQMYEEKDIRQEKNDSLKNKKSKDTPCFFSSGNEN